MSEQELEFDIAVAIGCTFEQVPVTSLKDWRCRDQTMWPRTAMDKVRNQGLWLSAKIGHNDHKLRLVDDTIDFSVSFPIWVLFGQIKGARHVLVCIKDVYKNFDMSSPGFKGPRSYFFKTVMVWLKEEQYVDQEPSYQDLFLDCLKKMLECYKEKHLRHFLIPEVNLLQDVKESNSDETIRRLELILQNPTRYLQECHAHKMMFSWCSLQICRPLITTDSGFLHERVFNGPFGEIAKILMDTVDYDNHNPNNESLLEKNFDYGVCKKLWYFIWCGDTLSFVEKAAMDFFFASLKKLVLKKPQ